MYGRVFYHVKLYVYRYTNNLRGPNELWRGRVTAGRHTSGEWYLFGGCNVLVVTTFRTDLLLFPLLFIVITRTWWVRQHLLCMSQGPLIEAPRPWGHSAFLASWNKNYVESLCRTPKNKCDVSPVGEIPLPRIIALWQVSFCAVTILDTDSTLPSCNESCYSKFGCIQW
jgi:hypothetical protein